MNERYEVRTTASINIKSAVERYEDFLYELNRMIDTKKLIHKHLALDMEISPSAVSYYLNGDRPITTDRLCALCIAVRLDPHDQRVLFRKLHWRMPDSDGKGDERERIIRHYLDFCRKDCSLTVKRCNKELRRKGYKPLTAKRGKSE